MMICQACYKVSVATDNEDCFEKALDVLKHHYTFYKNALLQRDLELQQIKERNEKLNKALKLLQTNRQPTKRFKPQNSDDCWLGNTSSQEERISSEHSLTEDERMGANNLNIALNSEQLFDTSSLSQNNDVSRTSSTEVIQSPRPKESPKRNKQHDTKRCLKDSNNTGLSRSKSEWHRKDRNSPVEKSWAMKFVHPPKVKASEEKTNEVGKKTLDKKLSLTLKKSNPSKMKQSLIHFNKPRESSFRELEAVDDIIDASPVVNTKNSKAARSWSHRSVQNSISNCSKLTNEIKENDDTSSKTLDDIVFDFSPSKKTEPTLNVRSLERLEPKSLKFNNDNSSDCTSLPNEDNLGGSTTKSDSSSSVVILTPGTEDIIFIDDTGLDDSEIDTMDLLADNLEKLKKYESKCILKQPPIKELETFKKPSTYINIKEEKLTVTKTLQAEEDKPCSSKNTNNLNIPKHQNPLLSSDEPDTEDDEDFMPKPVLIKQEPESSKVSKKLALKQRFNIDCEDCEKLINFLDEKLTDAQIQQHLDKCKHHNAQRIMRQNTPTDFWNPFILSFQADDPRNEVLIDNRFKENKK